ncbi:MAG: aldehyde dehydrogenase family protein, partial [Chloroflexota bacterium]|nr:aldehyde dehydrogenase family protein [Chloroflexota bacterium]
MTQTQTPGSATQGHNGHGSGLGFGIETGKLVGHLIGGQWVESAGGKRFSTTNPATGETLADLSEGSAADVDKAVAAASKAFKSWRLVPAPKRGEILFRAGQLLMERKEEMARLMTQEMGKVLAEARGDVQEAIDMTFYMAGEGRRLAGEVVPSELPN